MQLRTQMRLPAVGNCAFRKEGLAKCNCSWWLWPSCRAMLTGLCPLDKADFGSARFLNATERKKTRYRQLLVLCSQPIFLSSRSSLGVSWCLELELANPSNPGKLSACNQECWGVSSRHRQWQLATKRLRWNLKVQDFLHKSGILNRHPKDGL